MVTVWKRGVFWLVAVVLSVAIGCRASLEIGEPKKKRSCTEESYILEGGATTQPA